MLSNWAARCATIIRFAEISRAYGKYLEAIESVIAALDALVPKREWQRVKKQNF